MGLRRQCLVDVWFGGVGREFLVFMRSRVG